MATREFDTVYVLFEKDKFLGLFTTEDAADRLIDARISTGKPRPMKRVYSEGIGQPSLLEIIRMAREQLTTGRFVDRAIRGCEVLDKALEIYDGNDDGQKS